MDAEDNARSETEPEVVSPGRRTMLKATLGVLGAGVTALAAVPGFGSVLDPLLRRSASATPFIPLAAASVLANTGAVELPVIGERRDAWTRATRQRLGTVWLRKKEDGALLALSGECPHLGCRVGYSADEDQFVCPCHDARFDAAGKRLSGPSKRGMDGLEARIHEGLVEVRFKRFRTNREDQVELG